MALRQLKISKQIELKRNTLAELLNQEETFKTRDAELEAAINEAEGEEDIKLVEEELEKHEDEKSEHAEKKSKLEGEIAELEGELEELNQQAPDNTQRSAVDTKKIQKSEGEIRMGKRFNHGMTREARLEYLLREDVKGFYDKVREWAMEKRAVTGTELTIPDTILELIRDNIDGYSKLSKYVRLRPLKGTARQTISGEIPEAVWTEAVGKLNELDFSFSGIEVDGYKVGGFISIPKSTVEDSAINLADEVEYMLAEAIGYALDKAVVYGTGVKMPLGFVKNLPAGNVKTLNVATTTGVDFFKAVLKGIAGVKSRRAQKGMVFLMNEMTWKGSILPESLSINAAGTIVAAANASFPVIGATVEFLDFIPEGDIVGGYLEKYLLVERQGGFFGASEEVRWIEDEIVYKGTARYDGKPVRNDSFFAMNINNVAPTTTVSFVPDTANTEAPTV